ncbi:hypothetical protein [Alicyclobacillus fastidiosus]|uniref:hypothetical protein n=1 Tax=Alicyclobacillus fastidiosus TaxID=392011 RepID=UPI0023E971C0|nr:hypothetical protein [Alicyclobacillus fastidiosus]GMA61837.1 hypothetical protein GCM10025859_22770 [Alicyclobacillus fastidiosus]
MGRGCGRERLQLGQIPYAPLKNGEMGGLTPPISFACAIWESPIAAGLRGSQVCAGARVSERASRP